MGNPRPGYKGMVVLNKTMLKFLREKLTFIVPLVLVSGILFWAYGCEPRTKSLLSPSRKVSSGELQLELETIIGMYNLRIDDLEKQYELQQWFFEQAASFAQTGTVNPIGVLTSILSILGIGAAADNVRVRKKLKHANNTRCQHNKNS